VCQLLRTYTSLYGRLGASWKGGHERKQPVLRSWRNHGNCGVSLDEIILSFFPAQKWGVVSTVWRSRVSFSRVHVTFTHTSVLHCSLSLSLSLLLPAAFRGRFYSEPTAARGTTLVRQFSLYHSVPLLKFMHFPHCTHTLCCGKLFLLTYFENHVLQKESHFSLKRPPQNENWNHGTNARSMQK
jgi:hypothetical protein